MTRSSPCPMFTDMSWLLKSMKRFPSGVQKKIPLAFATGIGSTLDWADHSNKVCFLVRSTISCPVIDFSTVVVAINASEFATDLHGYSRINPIREDSCESVAGFLELAAVLFGPALNNNFLIRVELDGVSSLPVEVAEKAVLPTAEREICHRRGHPDVDSDVASWRFVAESPRGG